MIITIKAHMKDSTSTIAMFYNYISVTYVFSKISLRQQITIINIWLVNIGFLENRLTIRNSKLHKEDYRNTLVLVNWYMPSIQIAVIWCLSKSALLNSPSVL